jgi:hypothetical protein
MDARRRGYGGREMTFTNPWTLAIPGVAANAGGTG